MLKMVDGTGIIGVDMICPLGVSTPQPPNYDRVEMEGTGMLVLPNSLNAPLERLELGGKTEQVTTTGKNLLNSNIYVQGYLASIDTGQKISLNTEVKSFTTTMDINALQGKSISISIRTKGNSGKKYAFTDEKDVIINGKFDAGMADYSEYNNIQVPQNAKKFYFSVTYEVQENTKLQLEYGNKATSYEPYTGGKPSPSPEYPQEIKNSGKWNEDKQKYEIEVVLSGKNLLDITACEDGKTLDANGNIVNNANALLSDFIPCFSKTSYCRVGGHFTAVSFYDVEKNKIGSINQYDPCFATPDKCRYFRFSLNKTKADYEKAVANVGTALMDYEPHKKPQFLTLTSDRPLTKWDKLVEQDGQIGWLYKHKIIEDFSALVKDTEPIYGNDGGKYFSVSLQNASLNYDRSKIYSEAGVYGKDNKIHYIPQPMMANAIIHVSDTDTIMTAKEHMHYKVICETTESQFVPLPQSEQSAIRALKTYYPTTVITVDGGGT